MYEKYQICITRTTVKYIFMIYVLDIITIEIFVFIHGHALQNLSLTKKLYATHFRKEGIL
jgi:hypothetical protein